MKPLTLIIFAFLFLHNTVNSQSIKFNIDETTKKVIYSKSFDIQNTTKDKLYNQAIAWVNQFYSNSQSVTKKRDLTQGIIECDYYIEYSEVGGSNDKVGYIMTIQIKDNKYRYIITEFKQKKQPYETIEFWSENEAKYSKKLIFIDNYIKKLTESFVKKMDELKSSTIKENW